MKDIIIIDDDPISNFLSLKLFSLEGIKKYKKCFTDPVEALSFIQGYPINLDTKILLDLNMPRLNAWQFLEQCELKNISCSVFIITSSVSAADKETTLNYPMVKGFYTKPLTDKEVEAIINY